MRLLQSTPSALHKVKLYLRRYSLSPKILLAQAQLLPHVGLPTFHAKWILSCFHLATFCFLHCSRWWNTHTYTHMHWHSHCSPLRSKLVSSFNFFLNFYLPLLVIYRTLPHTTTVQTSKWLLFRPYGYCEGNFPALNWLKMHHSCFAGLLAFQLENGW